MAAIVLLDVNNPRPQVDPNTPKPTPMQAGEMVSGDARAFEEWAQSRDIPQAVFGAVRPAESGQVGFGFARLGAERWQVGIISEMVKQMSKESRLLIGTRVLLELEKEGYL
jgi:hypothetical protein